MAVTWPGIRIAVVRRSFTEIEESIYPVLSRFDWFVNEGVNYNENKHELRFRNRSLIKLLYLETPMDASRRQGGEYQLLCVDERTQMSPDVVEMMINERLRSRVGSGVPVIGVRSTSNPGGASHGDVKARYVDKTNYGRDVWLDPQGRSVRFIRATSDDNPYVNPAEYKASLDAIADPRRRAQMRDGDWDVPAGSVFSEWRHGRHVVQPFSLPEAWGRYMAVDYGFRAPWCVLWLAEEEDKRVYVYRELYDTEVGEGEQARRILGAEMQGENPWRVCDPSMASRRGDAASILEAYGSEGVRMEPAVNKRLDGWARVHRYLAEAPACPHHRSLGWGTCPLLHVFENCSNLIRTLPALPYSLRQPEDVDTQAEDHAADTLRYGLLSIGTAPEWIFDSAPAAGGYGLDGETRIRVDTGLGGWLPEDLSPPWSDYGDARSGLARRLDRRDAWTNGAA